MKNSGILMPIFSLPSNENIGTIGQGAYDFIDFLVDSHQSLWQILPLGPTSYGDSPYQATSSFGFNPYFIDLDMLVSEGILLEDDILEFRKKKNENVDYGFLFNEKIKVLKKAYHNSDDKDELNKYIKANLIWLDDYALYMTIKESMGYISWTQWPDEYKLRDSKALSNMRMKDTYHEYCFMMYLFDKQWKLLKKYAGDKGISIIGDIPIYCALDSVDVWANSKYFQLDENMNPTHVAGCPPDFFSPTGQLWGNPLYDYKALKEDGYSFWTNRIRQAFNLVDYLRIDHFRGFAGYYSIPSGEKTAMNGKWEDGPGIDFFKKIKRSIDTKNILAENLGILTPDVFELMDQTGFPGMNVLQFEFGDYKDDIPFLKGYKHNNYFYTGTHDNQTLYSFYEGLSIEQKECVNKIAKIEENDNPCYKLIELALETECMTVIIPFADYACLSDIDGRINVPGEEQGNWVLRYNKKLFTKKLSKLIYTMTKKSRRKEK